ncbi:MAG: beta-lactamase family protein [Acetobacteraceae bacterium]|nr:beta-lactamase family protein [Acetobacteraceae bacterium]
MLLKRRLFLGAATAALAAPAVRADNHGHRVSALDAAMRQLVEGRSTPGVVALILRDGRPVYARAVGTREAAGGTPISADDMFRLASMTKIVTSVAALQLVEQGRLRLDDPISRHLPEFANLQVKRPDGSVVPAERPPLLREALAHMAGFSYNFMNRHVLPEYQQARVVDGLSNPEVTTAEAMRRLASAPLLFQPGSSWEYSLATDVVGAIVERVTGRQLGEVIEDRIARPLGIRSFTFRAPANMAERFVPVTRPAGTTAALGQGVEPVRGEEAVLFPATGGRALLNPNRVFEGGYHSGGAGMSGQIGDYATFLQALANGGELGGARILRRETARLINEPVSGNHATLRGPGWVHSLGAGVLMDPVNARSRLPVGTWGWGGIYGTQFWVDPQSHVVGVVMTQTSIIGSGAIANLVREAYYG